MWLSCGKPASTTHSPGPDRAFGSSGHESLTSQLLGGDVEAIPDIVEAIQSSVAFEIAGLASLDGHTPGDISPMTARESNVRSGAHTKENLAAVHSNKTDDVGKERALMITVKSRMRTVAKVTVQSSEANPHDQTARLPCTCWRSSDSFPFPAALSGREPGLFGGWNAAEIRSSCSTLRGYLPPCDASARHGEGCAY
jgi:hypothetical protein